MVSQKLFFICCLGLVLNIPANAENLGWSLSKSVDNYRADLLTYLHEPIARNSALPPWSTSRYWNHLVLSCGGWYIITSYANSGEDPILYVYDRINQQELLLSDDAGGYPNFKAVIYIPNYEYEWIKFSYFSSNIGTGIYRVQTQYSASEPKIPNVPYYKEGQIYFK
jgi:hypothetical protein